MDRWDRERRSGKAVADLQGVPLGLKIPGVTKCQRDGDDPESELVAEAGMEHETAYLKILLDGGMDVAQIDAEDDAAALAQTLQAICSGRPFVYQAHLANDNFSGWADFLARIDGSSKLGAFHYEAWDTKLAKTARASFIIQLCAYAELLEATQGVLPAEIVIVLGTGTQQRYKSKDFIYCYRQFKKAFLRFQEKFDSNQMPLPGDSRSYGDWSEFAEEILIATDHLSRVANITRGQIQKLEDAGIKTMSAMAASKEKTLAGVNEETLQRLRRQSQLQISSKGKPRPDHEVIKSNGDGKLFGLVLLPPASPMDVFFDMEGFPLVSGGLEYLFGAVSVTNGEAQFSDWWAHDAVQEKLAFEGFVDWAYARWKANPSMHIYHYANYEVAAVRRLASKHATREREVDDLLRHNVFVDLYRLVRQGMIVGTGSYSLKGIEHLYMEPRTGEVTSAGGSVVAYHEWIDSNEPPEWRNSVILKRIRDYNEVDCISTWKLTEWLREQQQKAQLNYTPPQKEEDIGAEKDSEITPAVALAQKLLIEVDSGAVTDAARAKTQRLLAYLLEFHWREAKPIFWRMFHRNGLTHEELVHDFDCLGDLQKSTKPPTPVKKSKLFEYQFDPNQDTKLHSGCRCMLAHDLAIKTTIESLSAEAGSLQIKVGPKAGTPPDRISLIPDEFVSGKTIAEAVFRFVDAWSNTRILSPAVDDLIERRPPRIRGHASGPLTRTGTDLLQGTIDLVLRMDQTVLCIQGPPGTGKTYTAAAAIVRLLEDGCRVGVTANSHKAILNLLKTVHELARAAGKAFPIWKVGDDADEPMIASGEILHEENSAEACNIGGGPVLVGGTAWFFSRPELTATYDYLFVDEAGQFSLANAVAVGLVAKNLVLVGDQMQLAQPIIGAHPGESGQSALEYLLAGHATIPPEFGIFLDETRRLHPAICDFISEAVYENRLHSHPDTAGRRLLVKETALLTKDAGIQWIPIDHNGNSQGSPEEVTVIESLVSELLGGQVYDAADKPPRKLTLEDILIVAPFNMQVRSLQQKLGPKARIGSVDKFQGQEAHVVIVSMCSSSLLDSPRGAEFLFEPNRLNVAVTRAKTLAIVVGSPELLVPRCETIEEMRLANLFCWLVEYATQAAAPMTEPDLTVPTVSRDCAVV